MTGAVGLILVVLAAAGLGVGHGMAMRGLLAGERASHGPAEPIHTSTPHEPGAIVELKPLVTNLDAPAGAWVRLEAAIRFDPAPETPPDALLAQVTADFVAYLRTLSAQQLEGADGLRRLHADLVERAAIRSGGRIRDVFIETLVVQ